MEQLNDVLRYKKCVCREVKEHLMETQLHLPDYYPDICRILFCQVKPYAEHCSVENDRVVMDAVAEIRLLYCDADNRMQLFTSEVRYSKNAVLQKTVNNAVVQCSQNVVSSTYRAVGPRRVDVKASIAVTTEVSEPVTLQLKPDIAADVEVLRADKEFFDLHVHYSGSFVISESFSVQDERLKESRVLMESCRVSTTEVKLVNDKILIKGYLDMQLSCLHEKENTIFKYNENIAFSQVIDLYGVLETDICNVVFDPQKLNLSFRENGECDVSLSVNTVIIAGAQVIIPVVKDLFAVRKHANVHYDDGLTGVCCRPISENFLCSVHVEKNEYTDLQILAAYQNATDYTLHLESGKITAKGTIEVCAVIQVDSECQYIVRKIAFEQVKDLASCDLGCVFGSIVCKGVSCAKTADGLTLKAELDLVGCVIGEETIRYVDSYSLEEKEPEDVCLISLYFAQPGEGVWAIAKENRVPVQSLRVLNDLHEDIIKEDQTLLLLNH